MKKVMSIILSAVILTSALCTYTYALDRKNDSAENKITQVATEYLSRATRNMYLFEDNDLDSLSIALVMENPLNIQQFKQNRIELREFADNLELVNDKVSYYKYVRSAQEGFVNDFTQKYTVKNIQICDNVAVANITELLTWQYVDYDLPSAAEINYNVTLIMTEDKWLVASVVAPEEYFDQKYIIGDTEFNLDTKITQFNVRYATEKAEYNAYLENENRISEAPTIIRTSSYDPDKAVAYAQKWAMSRNDAFIDFGNVDCMNFASQCIYAGLGGPENTPDTDYMDKSGSDKTERWYWNDYESWCSCSDFRNYVNGSDAALNTGIYEIENGRQMPFWHTIVGSIAHVNTEAGGEYGHAIVFIGYESPLLKDIYFCAHSTNRLNEKFGLHYPDSPAYVITPESLS